MSDEADPLYVPLGDLGPWTEIAVDEAGWAGALTRLAGLRRSDPAWSAMVGRGARLAAAHRSGAMDGVHPDDAKAGRALLRGVATPADLGADVRPHVRANAQALDVAIEGIPAASEELVRRVHEVACRPQSTHAVRVEGRVQDHVFAHGEYKHHPNHVPVTGGGWHVRAPVAFVGPEMDVFVATLAGVGLRRLHPAVRAAYALYGMSHVAPFADGNGRVGRALAGALLLRSGAVPLLVPAGRTADYVAALEAADAGGPGSLVELVLGCSVDLVDALGSAQVSPTDEGVAALGRWRLEMQVAEGLAGLLPSAAGAGLDRHRARTDLGWLSPLTDTEVVASDTGIVLRAATPQGPVVEECVTVDAHPLDGDDGVVLRAEQAQVRLVVGLDETPAKQAARLHPWLDRVVSTLALRVAAETE